jgi:molybdate transport system substrate-binding protein
MKPAIAVIVACFLAIPTHADGAEIKVVASQNLRSVFKKLTPRVEQASGHKLVFAFDRAVPVKNRLLAGERVDVVISQRLLLDELLNEKKILKVVDIAYVSFGVIMRAGSPSPDIATIEGFKNVMLRASSIAHSDPANGTPAGIYLPEMFRRLGIAEQVRPKTRFISGGGLEVRKLVASGEVELGLAQMYDFIPPYGSSEGVALIGALPEGLPRGYVSGGIVSTAEQPDSGASFLGFLKTDAAAAVMKSEGFNSF